MSHSLFSMTGARYWKRQRRSSESRNQTGAVLMANMYSSEGKKSIKHVAAEGLKEVKQDHALANESITIK